MGSAFHQLCPRYSGTLTPLPLRLLGYGTPLPLPLVHRRLGPNLYVIYEDAHLCGSLDSLFTSQFIFKMPVSNIGELLNKIFTE